MANNKKKVVSRKAPRGEAQRGYNGGQSFQPVPTPVDELVGSTVSRPGMAGTAAMRRPAPIRAGEQRAKQPLSIEYKYVGGDLKRLAFLALGTFGVLLVLGFIIH
jgi:hypothetical protein